MTEMRKNQSEEWTYFTQLFIYFITVNKYQFCILVIGYINMQIIGIGFGYKKKNQYRLITSKNSTVCCLTFLKVISNKEAFSTNIRMVANVILIL